MEWEAHLGFNRMESDKASCFVKLYVHLAWDESQRECDICWCVSVNVCLKCLCHDLWISDHQHLSLLHYLLYLLSLTLFYTTHIFHIFLLCLCPVFFILCVFPPLFITYAWQWQSEAVPRLTVLIFWCFHWCYWCLWAGLQEMVRVSEETFSHTGGQSLLK